MHFTTSTIVAITTLAAAASAVTEHPAICTASYGKSTKLQAAIKSCCAQVKGKSVTFAASKQQGCQRFTLESFAKTQFYNCVKIGNGADVTCKAIKATPTAPSPTPVYCNVAYGKSDSNKRYIANCCSQAGAKVTNFPSKRTEKCKGFNLRDARYNKFVGCVQKRNLQPACYPVTTPSPTPKATPTSVKPVVTPPANNNIAPSPIVTITPTFSTSTVPETPVESTPAVNTDSSCQAFYDDASKGSSLQSCCTSAGGIASLDAESKILSCSALDVSTENQKFYDCASTFNAAVACVV